MDTQEHCEPEMAKSSEVVVADEMMDGREVAKDVMNGQAWGAMRTDAMDGSAPQTEEPSGGHGHPVPHVGTRRSTAAWVQARVRDTGKGDLAGGSTSTGRRSTTVRRGSKQTAAQFQWAAGERPRRCRTRLERSLYDGPSARRDAEEAERQCWLHVLADLVRHSPKPMGPLMAEQPGNVEDWGGGKHSKVRTTRKFQSWLHVTHGLTYPQTVEHFTKYMCMRLSEPYNTGALKTAHRATVF